MKIKELLAEKPMNFRTFGDVQKRLGTSAKVGFEFEMLIPSDSSMFDDDGDNRETVSIRKFNTLSEFEEYFSISRYDSRQIENDHSEWQAEKTQEWVDDNWTRYHDEDDENDSEEDAKERAWNDYDDDVSFETWISEKFSDGYDFATTYGLEPLYGWEMGNNHSSQHSRVYTVDTDEGSSKGTFDNIKSSLEEIIDGPIKVEYGSKQSNKEGGSWYIEPDGSIDGDGHGVELVSPASSLDDAINHIDKISGWMDSVGAETNSSTGLHINVSVPGIENLDPVKLVLMLGEKHLLNMFGRMGNSYADSQINFMIAQISRKGQLPDNAEAQQMIKGAKEVLANNKYYAVNLSKIKNGYIEVRAAGGTDYEKDTKRIKDSVYRIVAAMESACDHNMDRQEYIKKLSQLFNKAQDEIVSSNRNDSDKVPKELVRLSRINPTISKLYNVTDELPGQDRINHVIYLVNAAITAADKVKIQLDLKERVFLKNLLKKYSIGKNEIDERYKDDDYIRDNFKKKLGV